MVTRNGVAVLVLAASAFVLARVFGLLEFYVLGAGLVGLVVVALVAVGIRPVTVRIDRAVVPARPEVGDAAEVRLTVTADRRSPALEIWEPVGDEVGASLRCPPMRTATRESVAYVLPTSRRGTLRVGPMSAEVLDPFGLAHRRRWLAPVHDIVVRPRTVSLALPDLRRNAGPLARRLAVRALATSASDEFHALRDYIPGDDLRRVHWAATARRGDLLVRHHDSGSALHMLVVVDLDPASYRRTDTRADTDLDPGVGAEDATTPFDLAMTAAASLAASAAQTGRSLSLATSDGEELPTDVTHIDATLDRLAVLQPTSGRVVARSGVRDAALVVSAVITGPLGVERARRLANGSGPHDAAIVVACGASTTHAPSGAFVLAPRDHVDLQTLWNALVGGAP